jgi:2-oxoisovalerate dehydrogenase E1 component
MLPFRLDIFNDALVARVNGRDPAAVLEQGRRLVGQARRGAGPSILWCELDRLGPHTNADDPRVYRTAGDLDAMTRRDPVEALASRLIASGELTREAWADLRQQTHHTVQRVYLHVEQEPAPEPAGVADELFAPAVSHSPLPLSGDPAATMVTAINQTLAAALGKYGHVLLFGEDIEDPKGGVFGFTKGLSTRFPGRVVNSPLAEATIVGTAVGLAATGYKPVFEIQFIDFLTPAFHQLVAQVATLRWRTHGNWSCPLVLYAPYGAYLPSGGPWHSQSNEGWWTHTPGLRVAVPSTPADAAGLFWAAIEDEDPSLILIPKHLCRVRAAVEAFEVVPFGKAAIRRSGKDVTVVCWGNAVELAEQAAEQLASEGVSAEVIDLRSLVPCDWATLEASLARTGRLVVVQEDNRTGSFGASVIARLVTDAGSFYRLLAPPQLVSREDVHIPFHPDLERAVLPGVADVAAAMRRTLES